MMKKLVSLLLMAAMLAGCTAAPAASESLPAEAGDRIGEVKITLSDESVGIEYSSDGTGGVIDVTEETGVYTDRDIVYYEAGHDFTYGEGSEADAHTPEEAAEHVVVHITKPGTYRITGTLSAGQIAVDLGEEAENDPNAVVKLILDNVDITCTVAPAIIFYNVYECGDKDHPSAIVDTSAAGANVVIADGSVNNVTGSHVAKIYKEGTLELSEDGTEVLDAKKLHKYDAAFYSRMSMNLFGNDGVLNITADNEGLDAELHLTIHGGEINIVSGNDGINTNEDGVSVTTINGGRLNIIVSGETGEGDGIDSNGWLVINGGVVTASACGFSGDAGIDSDMGILINGGTVMASGNMLDRIEDGSQTHIVFSFAEPREPGLYTLKNEAGETVLEFSPANAFQYLILSGGNLTEGTYTLWSGGLQFQGMPGSMIGGFGPIERPEWPGDGRGDVEIPPQPTNPVVTHGDAGAGGEAPADMPVPQLPESGDPGQMPVPDLSDKSEQMPIPELPEGVEPPKDGFGGRYPVQDTITVGMLSPDFAIVPGANYFTHVAPV